mmetsp:Transcript_3446/g.5045  ORF Transcript_3446/g.5045 Transcript_3446/m.5045 type:complete len:202 (-) Transcript_3446:563-1168(-)
MHEYMYAYIYIYIYTHSSYILSLCSRKRFPVVVLVSSFTFAFFLSLLNSLARINILYRFCFHKLKCSPPFPLPTQMINRIRQRRPRQIYTIIIIPTRQHRRPHLHTNTLLQPRQRIDQRRHPDRSFLHGGRQIRAQTLEDLRQFLHGRPLLLQNQTFPRLHHTRDFVVTALRRTEFFRVQCRFRAFVDEFNVGQIKGFCLV